MHRTKRKKSTADPTVLLRFDVAAANVTEKTFHARTIMQRAGGWSAALASVLEKLNMRLESLLSFFAARLALLRGFHVDRGESMGLVVGKSCVALRPKSRRDWLVAVGAQIEVRALVTVVANTMGDINVARAALLKKFGCRGVVKLEQNHHRRMFRSA